jgi:hypothetical protein
MMAAKKELSTGGEARGTENEDEIWIFLDLCIPCG